jgi:hypothetical protein
MFATATAIMGLEPGPLFVRTDRTHRAEVIRAEEGTGRRRSAAAIRIGSAANFVVTLGEG